MCFFSIINFIQYCDVTCSCGLINNKENFIYILNNDFDNDIKIVPFTWLGVGAISAGQTITF